MSEPIKDIHSWRAGYDEGYAKAWAEGDKLAEVLSNLLYNTNSPPSYIEVLRALQSWYVVKVAK